MFCPGWIYEITVTQMICEYLSSELELDAFGTKYANGLNSRYADEFTAEMFTQPAGEIVQFLGEIEAGEDAVELLNNFSFYKLYNETNNKPRRMKPLFGSLEDGVKAREWNNEQAVKSFKAYIFGLRSNTMPKAPAGWMLATDEHVPELAKLVGEKLSILDVI